jgi:two-component system, NtrC family, response regulator HydG
MSGRRVLRVLVIDDDRDLAESTAEIFEARGHKVSLAFTGRDGLNLIDHQVFDLVLVDIEMPGMNGVDTFLEIRKKDCNARIALMTGSSIEQQLCDALDSGTLCLLRPSSTAADIVAATHGKPLRDVVLVSNDAAQLIARLEPFLSQQDRTTFIAQSNAEAFDRVIAGRADCLVLDQQLSSAAGLDLYLSLKRTGATVPTIIVTLPSDAHCDMLLSVQAMADGILKKPFDPEEVLARLEQQGART